MRKLLLIAAVLLITLTCWASQQMIEFEWEVENVQFIESYRLYMDTAPNVQASAELMVLEFPNADQSQTEQEYHLDIPIGEQNTYYFVLTAVASGVESDPSNEVYKAYFIPSAPFNLRVIIRPVTTPISSSGGN